MGDAMFMLEDGDQILLEEEITEEMPFGDDNTLVEPLANAENESDMPEFEDFDDEDFYWEEKEDPTFVSFNFPIKTDAEFDALEDKVVNNAEFKKALVQLLKNVKKKDRKLVNFFYREVVAIYLPQKIPGNKTLTQSPLLCTIANAWAVPGSKDVYSALKEELREMRVYLIEQKEKKKQEERSKMASKNTSIVQVAQVKEAAQAEYEPVAEVTDPIEPEEFIIEEEIVYEEEPPVKETKTTKVPLPIAPKKTRPFEDLYCSLVRPPASIYDYIEWPLTTVEHFKLIETEMVQDQDYEGALASYFRSVPPNYRKLQDFFSMNVISHFVTNTRNWNSTNIDSHLIRTIYKSWQPPPNLPKPQLVDLNKMKRVKNPEPSEEVVIPASDEEPPAIRECRVVIAPLPDSNKRPHSTRLSAQNHSVPGPSPQIKIEPSNKLSAQNHSVPGPSPKIYMPYSTRLSGQNHSVPKPPLKMSKVELPLTQNAAPGDMGAVLAMLKQIMEDQLTIKASLKMLTKESASRHDSMVVTTEAIDRKLGMLSKTFTKNRIVNISWPVKTPQDFKAIEGKIIADPAYEDAVVQFFKTIVPEKRKLICFFARDVVACYAAKENPALKLKKFADSRFLTSIARGWSTHSNKQMDVIKTMIDELRAMRQKTAERKLRMENQRAQSQPVPEPQPELEPQPVVEEVWIREGVDMDY